MKQQAIATHLKYVIRSCHTIRNKYDSYNFGSVLIKNITFLCRHSKRKKRNGGWYVCTVSCGIDVFATEPARAGTDRNLTFRSEFEIRPRSSQFEITIALYKLNLKTVRIPFLNLKICICNICNVISKSNRHLMFTNSRAKQVS